MEQHFWLGVFTAANTLLLALLAFNVSRLLHAVSMLGALPALRKASAAGTYPSELGGVVAVLICLS